MLFTAVQCLKSKHGSLSSKKKKKTGNVSAFIRGGKKQRRSGINSRFCFVAVFFFTRRCAKSAAHLRFLFSASTRGFMRRSKAAGAIFGVYVHKVSGGKPLKRAKTQSLDGNTAKKHCLQFCFQAVQHSTVIKEYHSKVGRNSSAVVLKTI